MQFQHYLKRKNHWPKGHHSMPETHAFNRVRGDFRIAGTVEENDCLMSDLPQHLSIAARINPFTAPAINIYAHVDGAIYPPHTLTNICAGLCFESIDTLDFEDVTWEAGAPLLTYHFPLPTTDIHAFLGEKRLLWPCGGFYQLGCTLQEIEPMIFGVMTHDGQSAVRMEKLSHFLSLGVPLNGDAHEHGWQFAQDMQDISHSLWGWIEAEKAFMTVHRGVDSNEENITTHYMLRRIEQKDISQNRYTLFFERGEEI